MIEERPCARMFCFCDRFASKNVGGDGSGSPGKIQFMSKTWSGEYKLHPRSPFARHVSQNHPHLAGTGIFLGDRSLQICFSFLKLPTSPPAKACIITQKLIPIFIKNFFYIVFTKLPKNAIIDKIRARSEPEAQAAPQKFRRLKNDD